MAAPFLEFNIIADRLQSMARSLIEGLRDEIVTGRATGVPDETTIQRVIEQRALEQGAVNGQINGIANAIFGRLRQIYGSTQAELAAGMEKPATLVHVLPEEAGYTTSVDDLGRKITNLGSSEGSIAARIRMRREQDFMQSASPFKSQERAVQAQEARDEVKMIWVAAFHRTCADCIRLAGQTKTLAAWKESGFFPGNGNTRCRERCQCHLAPVSRLAARFDLPEGEEGESQLATMLEKGVQLQKKKIEELEKLRGERYAESTYNQLLGQIRDSRFNPDSTQRESVFLKGSTENRLRKFINEQKANP